MGAPERLTRPRRKHRGQPLLFAVLVVVLTTVGASGGVLWLAAHLLPHLTGRSEEDPPVADVVELLKVALAVGMTKLVQS